MHYNCVFPNGFIFHFANQDYTEVNISTNGMLSFDATATNPASSSNDNGDLFAKDTGLEYVIAPWWEDLQVNSTNSQIFYEFSGTAPERILTVEWFNVSIATYSTPIFNFQVKLYESSNIIEMIYGPANSEANPVSASIGIKGQDATDPNFIEGLTGSSSAGNANLSFTDFPAFDTVIECSPK